MKVMEKNIDGKVYTFRLTSGNQKKLESQYKESAMQLILNSADDVDKMIELLQKSLAHKGNENGNVSGEDMYDMLVDEGMTGNVERLKLAVEIGKVSGVLDEKTADAVVKSAATVMDDMAEELLDPTNRRAAQSEKP